MVQHVRKVIIPVAGYGTRFLPATKAMPKEMLPIIDKPAIQYVVEEAVASGIEDVILVTSMSKRSVEDHFDDNHELEGWLKRTRKGKILEEIRAIGKLANFVYVRQKGPYGNATPVLNCRHLITNEPFAVLFGDEMFAGEVPRLRQMIDTYERYGDPVLGVIPVDDEGTKRYGIIDPAAEVEPGVYQVKGMMEKPGPEKAPSRLAAIGAYVLTPDIFDAITATKRGHGGEMVLLDAIFNLMKSRPVYARVLEGEYHDTGSKLGWLQANIAEALRRPDMRTETRAYLKKAAKA
ncbi:UTP--glucose-1-phosphate uridylyltransferase [Patescibacteria group bacterium]|nr:UTP--glucose-1-phosphate uridylyltransferase [Patescibacteria group bacterium]MBU1448970.1 UTP--glucose-1-phosphate uridylyltransferase [Patescibacteria group bacterium]MBU2613620.1 UTP--glucose-1-phosphate uridylyltransferase [Patescibacteria group bacterium]